MTAKPEEFATPLAGVNRGAQCLEEPVGRLAEGLIDLARVLRRGVPPPVGAPYFGLDAGQREDLGIFLSLAESGIFRKYGQVLELDAGLGGRARWLAVHLGCEMIALDPRPEVVRAAGHLNGWARLQGKVTPLPGRSEELPLTDRWFTHVWRLGGVVTDYGPKVLAEAWRVLRPGGTAVLHVSEQNPGDGQELAARVAAAGFQEVRLTRHDLSPPSCLWGLAWQRLAKQLASSPDVLRCWEALTPDTRSTLWRVSARKPPA